MKEGKWIRMIRFRVLRLKPKEGVSVRLLLSDDIGSIVAIRAKRITLNRQSPNTFLDSLPSLYSLSLSVSLFSAYIFPLFDFYSQQTYLYIPFSVLNPCLHSSRLYRIFQFLPTHLSLSFFACCLHLRFSLFLIAKPLHTSLL